MERKICPFCTYDNEFVEILQKCIEILRKVGEGDTSNKMEITTDKECLQTLINTINQTIENIGEFINLNHELAIGICEHFEVLRRLQKGDLSATASEDYSIEILTMLGHLINKQRDRFIDYINKFKEQYEDIVHLYEQQNAILSSVGVAIIVVEEDMTIEFANAEFESLTGYRKNEIEGKMKWTEFFTEEMLDKMIEYHKLRRISNNLAPRQYESKLKEKDGKTKSVLLNVGMIPYTKKSIASIIDISERQKIQEQLIHSQKMEALGMLAGRVAHEFNNILSGILGFTQLLDNKLEEASLKNFTKKIMEAGEKAKEIAKNLLIFSRKEQIGEIQKINLNQYFINFIDFIRPIIGRDIELKLKLPEDEIFYKIDPTHLEIILMNLITNSRDAMPNGGQIIIGLKEVCLDLEYHYTHPLVKPGDYVVICITDTGTGMDEQTKHRIFEPFFTTKPKGKGTGLGLSTVFGFVKRYEGHIHFYSEIDKGTTFKIYLPYQKKKKSPIIDKEALKGKEAILIIDDDSQIRQYISSFLKDYGYDVYLAKNGKEGIEILQQNKEKIYLCLIDLVMPGISGIETIKQIKNIKPTIKTIIMSGHPIEFKDFDSIEKTMSVEEILLKIRNILDEKE